MAERGPRPALRRSRLGARRRMGRLRMLPVPLPPASGGTCSAPVASTGHGTPERLRSGDFSTRCMSGSRGHGGLHGPKILRVYFLHHRELLGELMRAAAETVKELLSAAAGEEEGFRPGVVSVVQTFGDRANFHPHVHALVTRGGWTASGEWVAVPYVDERSAEELSGSSPIPDMGAISRRWCGT